MRGRLDRSVGRDGVVRQPHATAAHDVHLERVVAGVQPRHDGLLAAHTVAQLGGPRDGGACPASGRHRTDTKNAHNAPGCQLRRAQAGSRRRRPQAVLRHPLRRPTHGHLVPAPGAVVFLNDSDAGVGDAVHAARVQDVADGVAAVSGAVGHGGRLAVAPETQRRGKGPQHCVGAVTYRWPGRHHSDAAIERQAPNVVPQRLPLRREVNAHHVAGRHVGNRPPGLAAHAAHAVVPAGDGRDHERPHDAFTKHADRRAIGVESSCGGEDPRPRHVRRSAVMHGPRGRVPGADAVLPRTGAVVHDDTHLLAAAQHHHVAVCGVGWHRGRRRRHVRSQRRQRHPGLAAVRQPDSHGAVSKVPLRHHHQLRAHGVLNSGGPPHVGVPLNGVVHRPHAQHSHVPPGLQLRCVQSANGWGRLDVRSRHLHHFVGSLRASADPQPVRALQVFQNDADCAVWQSGKPRTLRAHDVAGGRATVPRRRAARRRATAQHAGEQVQQPQKLLGALLVGRHWWRVVVGVSRQARQRKPPRRFVCESHAKGPIRFVGAHDTARAPAHTRHGVVPPRRRRCDACPHRTFAQHTHRAAPSSCSRLHGGQHRRPRDVGLFVARRRRGGTHARVTRVHGVRRGAAGPSVFKHDAHPPAADAYDVANGRPAGAHCSGGSGGTSAGTSAGTDASHGGHTNTSASASASASVSCSIGSISISGKRFRKPVYRPQYAHDGMTAGFDAGLVRVWIQQRLADGRRLRHRQIHVGAAGKDVSQHLG